MQATKDFLKVNPEEWKSHVLTPKSRIIYGTGIQITQGQVANPENLLSGDSKAAKLEYPLEGVKPYIILDLGPSAPGGYPVFRVKTFKGTPVVRLAYSDTYEHIIDKTYGENGDFGRGTCKYLGVELPVPPANPYRYELYTVTSAGVYAFPLIQGQQRWVRFQLDTPGTEVEIECFYMHYTSDMSPHEGYFLCNEEAITKLWYSSTYTAQIASIENANAWEIVEGWLAPRALAKSNEAGLSRAGRDWKDYSLEFTFEIMKNPGPVSAVGWIIRAQDEDNGYAGFIDLDSRLHIKVRKNGVYTYLKNPVKLPVQIIDGVPCQLRVEVKGNTFSTFLDGRLIDTTADNTYSSGKVGFCQPLDKWAFVKNVVVKDLQGQTLLQDDFSKDLSQWDFRTTLSFLADGAKRDRLPWLGDLDWAGRNVYYAFRNLKYMADSLRMFAFNQTPEGYVWATCYPENTQKPAIGEYGYYQSDIFSAWLMPTFADYVLYSGDKEFAKELYDTMKLDTDYLWSYVEGDGLFCQRYDTSKGLWSHELEQVGKFSYHNILIVDAMLEAAFIADFLGLSEDAEEFRHRADFMREGIMKAFWDEEQGFMTGEPYSGEYDFMANALALAVQFVDYEKAVRISDYLKDKSYAHGKIISLLIRGLYAYHMDEAAMARLKTPGNHEGMTVNWLDAISDWRLPATTTECQFYPREGDHFAANGGNWGDYSHPDTAMAHIMSGYMLGIQPASPGYAQYSLIPQTEGLQWAKGSVPTPAGDLLCGWEKKAAQDRQEMLCIYLESPKGLTGMVGVPYSSNATGYRIHINGEAAYSSTDGFINGHTGYEDGKHVYFTGLTGQSYIICRENI